MAVLRKGILPILLAVVISFAGTRLVACAGPVWPSDDEQLFLDAYRDYVADSATSDQYDRADKLFVEAVQVLSDTYVENIDRPAFVERAIASLPELEAEDNTPSAIVGAALDESLHDLDPHSAYMTDEMFRRLQESTEGSFAGVGIVISQDEDKLIRIVSPIDDTPAARAGLQPNDRITHIDGHDMKGEPIAEAVRLMRGRIGDPVTLTIQRKQENFDITVKRARIEVPSVTASIIDNDLAYVRVSRFDASTLDQTREYLEMLEDQIGNPRGIIVDLRRNPGGLLDSAADIADQFLSDGLIVATEGRGERKLRSYEADSSDYFDGVPMAILLDRGSASGAELMAAALRENGRGVIIGEQSFGKGSMQRIMPLTSGGGLKITTGYYTTPENHIVQGNGVIPDIEVKLQDAEPFEREVDLEHALPPRRRDPRKVLASMDAASCERDINVARIGKSATSEAPVEAEGDGEAKELQRDTVLECAVGYFSDGQLAVYRDQVEPLLRAGL
ncbi:S41 family peptidase [Thalassospira xiamenensis]|jgi:carboxyl-terminal processing protease|uniref:Carboxyl-terminal protease n=1 Tax=Thalassospira xiamenensis TaxID=220697 RepID=A0A367XBE4_9PROT|nr:S41 family peptidase [Thalassospira xiamenensis]KZB54681.1 carboxyl-terminal protease [Thalassospira xiamenensis]MCK2168913.1 S41 family peptidase [Thalassospira xiamenensis]RCK50983.1 carboxyl-terminal protease [Thalassospira xiamenensis]